MDFMEEKAVQTFDYGSQQAKDHEIWFNRNTDTVLLALKYLTACWKVFEHSYLSTMPK